MLIRRTADFINDSKKYYRGMKAIADINSEFIARNIPVKKRIVINNVNFCQYSTVFFESLLAAKLRSLGAEVLHLIDDSVLRHIDLDTYDVILKHRKFSIREALAGFLLTKWGWHKKYSDFISKNDLKDVSQIAEDMISKGNYFFKGIDLKTYIETSVIRAFRSASGCIEEEEEYDVIHKICTENAIISLLVASKVNEHFDPDILVTSHAVYTTYGPFYKFFQENKKQAITWSLSGFNYGAVVCSKYGLVGSKHDDGFFEAFKSNIDINIASEFVETTMNKRANCCGADQQLFLKGVVEDKVFLENIKSIARGKKIFALFPNVFWDNSITGLENLFVTTSHWLVETVEYFSKQDDKMLIIRAHPAEANYYGARVYAKDILERKFGMNIKEIKNCIYIPPDNSISSYSLFPLLNAGIVCNGTIGLEMMYKKIPVLVSTKAAYTNKGFTFDFMNKKEYFNGFDQIEKILDVQNKGREKLIKFMFYYMRLNEIPILAFNKNKHATPDLSPGMDAIMNDNNLSHIAEVVLGKDNFFQEWFFKNREPFI